MKMSTHQTGKMVQVTTSSKIKTKMTKEHTFFECIPGILITHKDDKIQSENMKYLQHIKTSTMITSLKMEKSKKSLRKKHTKMSTHQRGKMIQVTTSSKIKTKITKKTPPFKMMAQKNY